MKRFLSICLVVALVLTFPMISFADGELKKGSKGDEVKVVQERLIELGFLTGNADGSYGKQSEEAVKGFQKTADIPETGVVDQTTMNVLLSPSAPYKPYKLPQGVTLGMSFDEIQEIFKPLFLAYEKEYEKEAEEGDMDDKDTPGWSIEWNGTGNAKTPFLDVDVFGLSSIVTFTFRDDSLSGLKSVRYKFPVSEMQMQGRVLNGEEYRTPTEQMLLEHFDLNEALSKTLGESTKDYYWTIEDGESIYGEDYAEAIDAKALHLEEMWEKFGVEIRHVLYMTEENKVIHELYFS